MGDWMGADFPGHPTSGRRVMDTSTYYIKYLGAGLQREMPLLIITVCWPPTPARHRPTQNPCRWPARHAYKH